MTINEMTAKIYDAYPRKIARRAAIRAISNALTRIHDGEVNQKPLNWDRAFEFLLVKTQQYAESPAGNRENFTPHPTTFFNQSRYLDHEIEWYRQTEAERLRALNQVGVWRPE